MSFIFESCKEAIRVAFLGCFLLAVGFLIQNESINIFYTFKSAIILLLGEYSFKLGECIIINLPLIFMLNFVCKKTHSAFPLISAVLGYFSFLIATMLFASTGLDSTAYLSNSFLSSAFGLGENATRLPLNTGMIGSIIIALITRYTYIRSRHNNVAYSNSYFDKDVFGIVFNVILCLIAGIAVSFAYPLVFNQLKNIFTYISTDLTDPLRVGLFGILDRLFTMLGLPNIVKNPFYFSSLGGSYQVINGQIATGDVNIWNITKDLSEGYLGAGRFITPYYVINIFMIPMFYLGIYKSITNGKEKSKFLIVFTATSILSIICGNPLPTELLLLFSAPVLLIIYLLAVGVVFGALTFFNIYLGSNIYGMSAWTVMPGNLPDYLINLRNVYHIEAIKNIAIVGVVAGIIVFLITYFYYRYLAIDTASITNKDGLVNQIYESVGGKENIRSCTSGLYRVMIEVHNIEKIDAEIISKLNVSKVALTKNGVNIDVGASAYIVSQVISGKEK